MKYLKYLAITVIFFSTIQTGFSQNKECENKLKVVMQDYQNQIELDEEITREKAEALLEVMMEKAYKKYPECFPEQYKKIHDEIVEEDKKEDRIVKEKEKENEPIVKTINPKDAEESLPSSKKVNIRKSPEYQEYKKGCVVILREQLKAMRKDLKEKLAQAESDSEKDEIMQGYKFLRREMVHSCAMEKMEEGK